MAVIFLKAKSIPTVALYSSANNGNNVDKIFYDITEIIVINGDNNYYDLTNNDCRITFTSRGAVAEGKKKFY